MDGKTTASLKIEKSSPPAEHLKKLTGVPAYRIDNPKMACSSFPQERSCLPESEMPLDEGLASLKEAGVNVLDVPRVVTNIVCSYDIGRFINLTPCGEEASRPNTLP